MAPKNLETDLDMRKMREGEDKDIKPAVRNMFHIFRKTEENLKMMRNEREILKTKPMAKHSGYCR